MTGSPWYPAVIDHTIHHQGSKHEIYFKYPQFMDYGGAAIPFKFVQPLSSENCSKYVKVAFSSDRNKKVLGMGVVEVIGLLRREPT
jgi:hypothetical protein